MTSTNDHLVPVVVTRWRRYGHDRAYVRLNGETLGYRDVRTGAVECDDDGLRQLVADATAEFEPPQYQARHATPDAVPTPDPAPAPETLLAPDRDLALNPPGAAARDRAIALRDEAPIHTFIARALGVKTEERSYRVGADGEEEVARQLARLGDQWRVLHAIPVGQRGSDIDHLVIGPSGVFTINTKRHPGASVWVGGDTVKVNGQNQHYVRNSRFEARRAAALLTARALFDVDVTGLIAVTGAAKLTVRAQPADEIRVVTRRDLCSHLRRRPVVLGAPSIERIHAVARHLATWQPTRVAWSDAV